MISPRQHASAWSAISSDYRPIRRRASAGHRVRTTCCCGTRSSSGLPRRRSRTAPFASCSPSTSRIRTKHRRALRPRPSRTDRPQRQVLDQDVPPERLQQRRALSRYPPEPLEPDLRRGRHLDINPVAVARSQSSKVRLRSLLGGSSCSPANAEAAQLYRENMKEYVKRVRRRCVTIA